MLPCSKCSAPNSLDSQFCKACGAPLSEDSLAEARIKLDEMIDQGNTLFTEGRTEEAIMIADAAIESNPSYAMAYSLKGLCFERQERLADALECYEKAFALNPDSTLDKIKVAALRHRLEELSKVESEPERWRAFGIAAGVVLFLGALGAAWMYQLNHQTARPTLTAANRPSNIEGFASNPNAAGTSGGATGTNQQAGANPTGTNPAGTNPAGTNQNGTQSSPPVLANGPQSPLTNPITYPPADGGNGQLPLPGGDIGYQPLKVGGQAGVAGSSQSGGQGGTGQAGASQAGSAGGATNSDPNNPAPTLGSGASEAPKGPTKPKEIIDIQVGSAGSTGSGNQMGSVQVGSNNGLAAVRRTAANQYELGQYQSAASTYERLVKMGGDSADVRQRLGQIYARLGKNDKAIENFKSAVQKYQDLIASGTDVSVSKAGLAACRQELKLLGG